MARKRRADARLEALGRIATADTTSDGQMLARVRAVRQLLEAGDRSPVSRSGLRRALQTVIEAEPVTQRGAHAALAAITTLDEMDRPPGVAPQSDSADPDQLLPASWEALGSWDRPADLDRARELYRQWQEVAGRPKR